jgi:hypothetical protein
MVMTLDAILLQKLAEWRPTGPGRHTLHVPASENGWTAAVMADQCDPLSCLVWDLSLRRTSPMCLDAAGLKSWADRVAGRATGLVEPLQVIEVDTQRGEAQLRSSRPSSRSGQPCYFELLLKGTGQVSFRRLQASHQDSRREQVAFPLTHEMLAKLVADLTAES